MCCLWYDIEPLVELRVKDICSTMQMSDNVASEFEEKIADLMYCFCGTYLISSEDILNIHFGDFFMVALLKRIESRNLQNSLSLNYIPLKDMVERYLSRVTAYVGMERKIHIEDRLCLDRDYINIAYKFSQELLANPSLCNLLNFSARPVAHKMTA